MASLNQANTFKSDGTASDADIRYIASPHKAAMPPIPELVDDELLAVAQSPDILEKAAAQSNLRLNI